MNLKEAFRYQHFLATMMSNATMSICSREHALKATKLHKRNSANHEAEDVVEVVEPSAPFAPNDEVVRFIAWLIGEREKLSAAISEAKRSLDIDIDVAIETNKFRQNASSGIKRMLCNSPAKRTEKGSDYKFNAEGNQMPYYYEIEVTTEEAYDKAKAKELMRSLVMESDKTSAAVDAAMINSVVDYEPRFDVNDTFDDVMAEFMETK